MNLELKFNAQTYRKFMHCQQILQNCDEYRAQLPERDDPSRFYKFFNTLNIQKQTSLFSPYLSDYFGADISSLPTWDKKDAVLTAVDTHRVTIVTAEPGSDKSIQLPQCLIDKATAEGRSCKIIFSQPRPLSAYALALRYSEQQGEEIGKSAGYHIDLYSRYSDQTPLIYCTNEILIKTLMNRPPEYLNNITYIIIDEIQERDVYSDFLLFCLKYVISKQVLLKIILIATKSDLGLFESYFEGSTRVTIPAVNRNAISIFLDEALQMTHADILTSKDMTVDANCNKFLDSILFHCLQSGEEKFFQILLHFLCCERTLVNYQSVCGCTPMMVALHHNKSHIVQNLLNLGADVNLKNLLDGLSPIEWALDHSSSDIKKMLLDYRKEVAPRSNAVTSAIVDFALIAKIIKLITSFHNKTTLVLLACYEDALTCKESLLVTPILDSKMLEIVLLYDAMDLHTFQNVCKEPKDKLKIILSTSVGECNNLLLPSVGNVIDCGRHELRLYNGVTRSVVMENVWITKDQAAQRAAKAKVGENPCCFHLYTKQRYELMNKDACSSPSQQPLHEIYLQAKFITSRKCNISNFLQIISVSSADVRSTIEDLIRLKALNFNETLTPLGKTLSQFPLEPRLAKMLCYGVVLKCLDPILTIVAFLAYKNPFILPQDTSGRQNAFNKFQEMAGGHFSDHLLLLRIYQFWQDTAISSRRDDCEKYFIDWHTMEIIHEIRGHLLSQLRGCGFVSNYKPKQIKDLNENSFQWCVVKAALTAGYPTNIALFPSTQQVTFDKYSALHTIRNRKTNEQLCIIFEKMYSTDHSVIRFGTAVTPITVALVCVINNIKSQLTQLDTDVSQAFLNILQLSWIFNKIAHKKIANPDYKLKINEKQIIDKVKEILCREDVDFSFKNPSNVGTVPKLFVNVRSKTTEQQFQDYSRQHGYRQSSVLSQLEKSPGSSNAVNPNTPETPVNLESSTRTVYFIIKSPTKQRVINGMLHKTWRFSPQSEREIFSYFNNQYDVILFFGAANCKEFLGFARLEDTNNGDVNQFCQIRWLSTSSVSFDLIRYKNIRNAFNNHSLVSEGREGQQVEYWCAQHLTRLFAQSRNSSI